MARNIRQIKFVDPDSHPIEASESGQNAHYCDHCNHAGHKPSYAACLHKIKLRKSGRLNTIWSDCSAAIGRKDCQALAMRKQEIDAGKALFFIDRAKLLEVARLNASVTGSRYGENPLPLPSAKRSPPVDDTDSSGSSYAAAINKAIRKEIVASKEKPPVVESRPNKSFTNDLAKGLSLVEIARLARAKTQTIV